MAHVPSGRPQSRDRVVLGILVIGVLLALAGAWIAASRAAGAAASEPTYGRLAGNALAGRVTVFRQDRLARTAITWRGGPLTASTGETVNVFISDALPLEVTPEYWAEFLAKMVHGSELPRLTLRIAPLSEVQQLCGRRAIGCYGRDTAIAAGETLPDGTTPEEIVRHEYGHHIAAYRANTPWTAIDWGPKYWASVANICARAARREAFPGDEGPNYARNPGEAWAEVYRLMDERKAGITTGRWPIVASTFYPSEAALQAAERDVLQPWTAPRRTVVRKQVRRGQVWYARLTTPLDGQFSITVNLPRGGQHSAALVAENRRTVLRTASTAGPRLRRLSGNICGQRTVYVRVTQKGAPGRVSVTATIP